MTVSDILERTWEVIGDEAAAIDGCYHRRIPILSEWPVHAGICRPTNLRTLILETDTKSARSQQLPEATNGYSIEVAESQSADGARTHIRIHETNLRFREVFTIFSADIVEHWVPHAQASDSLRSLKRRLSHWRAFFQRGAHLGLSREDYVGLYGELSFIEEGLAAGIESLQMVTAWQAPLATNQDFLFGALAAEIKTTTGNDIEKIRINNARQLDSSTLDCLCLTSYAFDFRRGNGRTLHQLVSTLKDSLRLRPKLRIYLKGDCWMRDSQMEFGVTTMNGGFHFGALPHLEWAMGSRGFSNQTSPRECPTSHIP